jgi:hypothetical protein
VPNPNLLSAVLAIRFGQGVILLGGDALKKNWDKALRITDERLLPKAQILKVPHHGARNALNLNKSGVSYLDVCSYQPKAKAFFLLETPIIRTLGYSRSCEREPSRFVCPTA